MEPDGPPRAAPPAEQSTPTLLEATPETPPPQPRDAVQRSHKVPRARRGRGDYLRLDLAESTRPASPRVVEALQRIRSEDLSHYPDPWPLVALLSRLHRVSEERLTVTAGADEAIRWTFNAYVEAGARVVIPRPSFGAFLAAAEAGGAFVERVDHEEDLEFPFEQLKKTIEAHSPRLCCIANPNAPTGTALSEARLQELAAISPGTLFLVNEVFSAYHGSSLLDEGAGGNLAANLLVLRSLSKDYGLAGMRVGYLVGHPDVIAAIDLARPSYTVSSASLVAAEAALSDPEAMLAHVTQVKETLGRLANRLETRGIESRRTEANFLLVRLSAPIQPWAAAFAAHKVLVGTAGHGGALADYVRVTVNNDGESSRFVDTLDLLLRMGVPGATRVEGVPGSWDEMDSEGMA